MSAPETSDQPDVERAATPPAPAGRWRTLRCWLIALLLFSAFFSALGYFSERVSIPNMCAIYG